MAKYILIPEIQCICFPKTIHVETTHYDKDTKISLFKFRVIMEDDGVKYIRVCIDSAVKEVPIRLGEPDDMDITYMVSLPDVLKKGRKHTFKDLNGNTMQYDPNILRR